MHIQIIVMGQHIIIVHILRSHVDRVVFLPLGHIEFLVKSKVEYYENTQLTMNKINKIETQKLL